MNNDSFDDLLQALQTALFTAQDTLKKRRDEAVRRMCNEAERAGSESPYYTFAIPGYGGVREGYEILSLPAASFRSQRRQQIAMLSLEFECEFSEKKLSRTSRVCSFAIKTGKKRWWLKTGPKMQVVLNGTGPTCGEVRIDGTLLMEIPRYESIMRPSQPKPKHLSNISLLIDRLRNLWRPQTFIMTPEQSERTREILIQRKTRPPPDEAANVAHPE